MGAVSVLNSPPPEDEGAHTHDSRTRHNQTAANLLQHRALRVSLGVIFFWFGTLKFFPGPSPAQGLALNTMDVLTFVLITASAALILLATLKCAIGVFSIHTA